MRHAALLLSGIFLSLLPFVEDGAELVPAPAPALSVETVLQGPPADELSWEALRGKAVVVDFWGTWCLPCVAAIPHWNELVAEFADQPVRFLAITDEKESVVTAFLDRKPISGWIGLDTDRSVLDAFEVRGLPHTVMIDGEGRVRAATRPLSIDRAAILALIAGKTPRVDPPSEINKRPEAAAEPAGNLPHRDRAPRPAANATALPR